jgi:hypothetical protein
VASSVRSGNMITAMRQIVEDSPLGLRDAKGIALHITREPQRCHRCKQSLEGAPVSVCPSCRALNYDW